MGEHEEPARRGTMPGRGVAKAAGPARSLPASEADRALQGRWPAYAPGLALPPNQSCDEAKHPQRAAIYLRVSTDTQTTANQEPDCLRLGESQGWDVVEVYREQESAVKRRPIFSRMMADARNGRFRFLIVWRLIRFGRSMQGNINDVLELERAGVSVVSVKEPWLAVEGSARNLLLAIFSWLAEEERRVLVERVRAGIARARAEGKRCGKAPVLPEKVTAAAASVRQGASIRTAAREQGIGYIPVRGFLALAASEGVRAGSSIRAMSGKYRIGVDTIRRVMAGTSYLCRYPSKCGAPSERDDRALYLPFGQAREVARGLGIRTKAEWIAWCTSDAYRASIPMQPWEFYRGEWQGWVDWLAFETRLPFAQARAFARGLGFHSPDEWRQWCRDGKRPPPYPAILGRPMLTTWDSPTGSGTHRGTAAAE
jgi:putative DNA-invertase from lambdoid prophage Rac